MKIFLFHVTIGVIALVKCDRICPDLNAVSANEFQDNMTKDNNSRSHSSERSSALRTQTDICYTLKKLLKTDSRRTGGLGLPLKQNAIALFKCLKLFSFQYLDKVLEKNRFEVLENVFFIKNQRSSNGSSSTTTTTTPSTTRDRCNITYVESILNGDWRSLAYERLENFLTSHSLKFQLDTSVAHEGRGRRRDHRMLALMVMGFMIMASILIPTGFQFLTVLGGKSLLMAKMALIMSAISGLKKIATSNVGYGFYHTGGDGHHHDHIHGGFHDKLYQVNPQQTSQYGLSF